MAVVVVGVDILCMQLTLRLFVDALLQRKSQIREAVNGISTSRNY